MLHSNALTFPLAILVGVTLSTPVKISNGSVPSFSYHIENQYQTTSLNSIAKEFRETSPRSEALQLFGEQSSFSIDEQKTYRAMLKQNSKNVGINIFDLF